MDRPSVVCASGYVAFLGRSPIQVPTSPYPIEPQRSEDDQVTSLGRGRGQNSVHHAEYTEAKWREISPEPRTGFAGAIEPKQPQVCRDPERLQFRKGLGRVRGWRMTSAASTATPKGGSLSGGFETLFPPPLASSSFYPIHLFISPPLHPSTKPLPPTSLTHPPFHLLAIFPRKHFRKHAEQNVVVRVLTNVAREAVHEAAVAERLDCSPPIKANWVQSTTRVTPGFSKVGIVPDNVAGRWVFSGVSSFPHPCIPALLHAHIPLPSSAPKTSLLRADQIFSLAHTSSAKAWGSQCWFSWSAIVGHTYSAALEHVATRIAKVSGLAMMTSNRSPYLRDKLISRVKWCGMHHRFDVAPQPEISLLAFHRWFNPRPGNPRFSQVGIVMRWSAGFLGGISHFLALAFPVIKELSIAAPILSSRDPSEVLWSATTSMSPGTGWRRDLPAVVNPGARSTIPRGESALRDNAHASDVYLKARLGAGSSRLSSQVPRLPTFLSSLPPETNTAQPRGRSDERKVKDTRRNRLDGMPDLGARTADLGARTADLGARTADLGARHTIDIQVGNPWGEDSELRSGRQQPSRLDAMNRRIVGEQRALITRDTMPATTTVATPGERRGWGEMTWACLIKYLLHAFWVHRAEDVISHGTAGCKSATGNGRGMQSTGGTSQPRRLSALIKEGHCVFGRELEGSKGRGGRSGWSINNCKQPLRGACSRPSAKKRRQDSLLGRSYGVGGNCLDSRQRLYVNLPQANTGQPRLTLKLMSLAIDCSVVFDWTYAWGTA
ncbi:hypothetical protein PR048_020652 [Dryococelus australis]|uniref:Uncharacterized protein n=1 Tax=Dryococelus australis TaxID=614101 RepID=A0ABQ9H727_9NEOP|nr:hypothetical protein PR048_020652 [Dryococelus australis]